ncbi:MAG: M3 family metallopeptidase [Rikenellaceae bacterium]
MKNILLDSFNTPYGTPPFSKIKADDFLPAIKELITKAKEEIDTIATNKDVATYQNTVEALEYATIPLDNVAAILFNLNHAHTSPKIQSTMMEVAPMLASLSNDISLNSDLFSRISEVYKNRNSLTKEQKRLTQRSYEGFVRGGANLKEPASSRYREVTEELSTLTEMFTQRVLAATNDYILHLTDQAQLEGLTNMAIDSAKQEAETRGLEGWVITLQAQSFMPFLKYSTNRELRHTIWSAYNSRCFKRDENDNQEAIQNIVNLRLEMANILGYKSYAEYVLEENMAKDSLTVMNFLDYLLKYSLTAAQHEIDDISEFAATLGHKGRLEAWDFSFYSEKYKEEHFSLSEEMLKPYFQLDNVVKGLFSIIEELYGITFKYDPEIEKYHDDVEVYQVWDKDNLIAILYLDFFPRESKSGGAWMTSFRDRTKENIPLISVVCNFTKPTAKEPSLLTFNEVTTIFHEMGHALHGIFSIGNMPSISGTNVARDFVELPSQIMENWALESTFLSRFAIHHKNGNVMPAELVDKIIASRNFLSGYQSVRQLSFGYVDMGWHTIEEPLTVSVKEMESVSSSKCRLFTPQQDTCLSTAFTHIFSGGYSAGYYSYKWAETLEADAYSLFQEKGVMDKETANLFRQEILSQGDMEDAMDLYVKFRGRAPLADALLFKLGLKTEHDA